MAAATIWVFAFGTPESALRKKEVVPFVVEFEVAVPRLTPAVW
jgi:hypothetical protein